MKKLLAVLCVLCLAACSGKGESKTTVCEGYSDGANVTNVLESEGDNIVKQVSTNKLDYSTIGLSDDDVKQAAETFKQTMSGIKGVSYEYTIENSVFTETTTIDYTNADMSQLVDKALVDGDKSASYVSLDKTISSMESQGFTCK